MNWGLGIGDGRWALHCGIGIYLFIWHLALLPGTTGDWLTLHSLGLLGLTKLGTQSVLALVLQYHWDYWYSSTGIDRQ